MDKQVVVFAQTLVTFKRSFFEKLKVQWGIAKSEGLALMSAQEISKTTGGSKVMRNFKFCLKDALTSAYPGF